MKFTALCPVLRACAIATRCIVAARSQQEPVIHSAPNPNLLTGRSEQKDGPRSFIPQGSAGFHTTSLCGLYLGTNLSDRTQVGFSWIPQLQPESVIRFPRWMALYLLPKSDKEKILPKAIDCPGPLGNVFAKVSLTKQIKSVLFCGICLNVACMSF